jgi:hypothetical protein
MTTLIPRLAVPVALITFAGLCSFCRAAAAPAPATHLSGPYVHDNLAIYLVHGPTTLKGNYLTLEEAMKSQVVRVLETGDVNELAIENRGDVAVFVQSGDIVKGGQQDRTIATDFVLPPKSGKVPVSAFCVESGRWQRRGSESATMFGSSANQVAGRELKLAGNSNYSGNAQHKVWEEVSANQQKLKSRVMADVASTTSPSSYQLTLENKKVADAVEGFMKALGDAPKGKDDVLGYVAVINGKLNCADVYGSPALLTKLWPRMLKSLATEAEAEVTAGKKFEPMKVSEVEAALRSAEDGKRTKKRVNRATSVTTIESKNTVQFECYDSAEPAAIRRNILATEPESARRQEPTVENAPAPNTGNNRSR